ncbi:MAG: ribonuclease III [Tenericutes bacterium]|nr:ribonuclease III [Mycoplasmatota bacterium]
MKLLDDFNIKTDNMEIYDIAFSHSSYCNEHNLPRDYQRLEFLGDKVLDLIMSDYLYNTTDYEEGKMTKIRSMYVCENALYEYANILNFKDYAKLGVGEEKNNVNNHKAIYADMFESFLGAVYQDQGYLKAKEIVYSVAIPFIEKTPEVFFMDYKSRLQELVQTDKKSIKYVLVNEQGPAHDRLFTTNVIVDNVVLGTGTAKSKKEAEQNAAKSALEKEANI